jgi:activator of HSP90 ATPase
MRKPENKEDSKQKNSSGGEKMKTKTIRQSVTFKADPKAIYEALMDSRKHSQFTGDKASISREVGGKFTAYDSYIEGINLHMEPNKKIVQSWRGSDWPEGHYSRVTFLLQEAENGTRLTFTQTGVPDQYYEDISQGWHDYYWKPLKEMLEK